MPVQRKLPRVAITDWNCSIRTVNVIFENREILIECFEELEEKGNKTITCKEAYGLRRTLEDPDFVLWLKLFYNLFPPLGIRFYQFQVRNKDSVELHKHVQEFEITVTTIRNAVDEIAPESEITNESMSQREMITLRNRNTVITKEVCDTTAFLVKEKLSCRGHLGNTSLVYVDNFLKILKVSQS